MPLAAPRLRCGGLAEEAGGDGLGEERADRDQHHAGQDERHAGESSIGRPIAATPSEAHMAGRVPKRARPLPGHQRRDDRGQEDEIDEAELHAARA